MKALSLWQPWASAIAVGAKRVETRSWATSYRGPLAIHAAKRLVKDELLHFHCSWAWTGALWPLGFGMIPGQTKEQRDARPESQLPFGAIVAVCRLTDCRPTGSFRLEEIEEARTPAGVEGAGLYLWTERMMGDFSAGRFGWVLEDVRRLADPLPCVGRQGLFEVDDWLLPDMA